MATARYWGLLEAACASPGDLERGGTVAFLDWSWTSVLIPIERGGAPVPVPIPWGDLPIVVRATSDQEQQAPIPVGATETWLH